MDSCDKRRVTTVCTEGGEGEDPTEKRGHESGVGRPFLEPRQLGRMWRQGQAGEESRNERENEDRRAASNRCRDGFGI